MLPPKSSLTTEIEASIDLDLFLQRIQHRSFEVVPVVQYIISKMLQLCAPVRDSSIRAILNEQDLGVIMSKILDSLEEMRFDLMNYQLKSLVPVLSQHAVEYEKEKFKQIVGSNATALEKTKQWLQVTNHHMKTVAEKRNPEGIDIPQNRIKFEDIFNDGYLSLIFSSDPISRETVPETFLLDTSRLWGFQNEIQGITIVAVLLMLSKNIIPELRRDNTLLEKMKVDLFTLLKDGSTSIPHLITYLESSLSKFVTGEDETSLERKKNVSEQIETMVKKTLSTKDHVYSLLNRRILNCLKNQVATGTFKKEGPNSGLAEVGKEIENLGLRVLLLAKHNKQVYGEWYDEILRTLA
jgi:hypothetical protein